MRRLKSLTKGVWVLFMSASIITGFLPDSIVVAETFRPGERQPVAVGSPRDGYRDCLPVNPFSAVFRGVAHNPPMGEGKVHIISRVLGIVLAAIAVQYVLNGITGYYNLLVMR